MRSGHILVAAWMTCLLLVCPAQAQRNCSQLGIDPTASIPLQAVPIPPQQICAIRAGTNGSPTPDPACTPGDLNLTEVLDNSASGPVVFAMR
jgi:hypothetical protein